MILKNGLVFTEDARFVRADVEIADGKIAQVAAPGTLDGPDAVDVSGKYVTPGFVISTSTAPKALIFATRARSTSKQCPPIWAARA